MHDTVAREIIEEMGGKVLGTHARPRAATTASSSGGEIIHEAGTTRMGDEPAHLGAQRVVPGPRGARTCSWPTAARSSRNAHKNMTWTILALSMRTAEHIAEERERGTSDDRARLGRRGRPASCIGARPRWPAGFAVSARRRPRPRTQHARARPRRRPTGRPTSRSSSRAHEWQTVRVLVDIDHPAATSARAAPPTRGARVHGLRA